MSKKTQFGFVMKKVEVDRAINLIRGQLKGAQSSCWKELKAASKAKDLDAVKEWSDRAARAEELMAKFVELQALLKKECAGKASSAKLPPKKCVSSGAKKPKSSDPKQPPKVKGHFQIGRVVHRYFPIAFSHRGVTQKEIELFLSNDSKRIYGTVGVPVLKISTGAENERFVNGIMRFYSDIAMKLGGVTYLLSSQFITKKSRPVLDWLESKGFDKKEMMRVGCGEIVPPSPYDKIDQLSIKKNVGA